MAKRWVDTMFWRDSYIQALSKDEKHLFLYLLTSPDGNIAGVFQSPLKIISCDTDIKISELQQIFVKFETDHKIIYREGWVVILNRLKYNVQDNQSIKKGVEDILKNTPDFIRELLNEQSVDSLSPVCPKSDIDRNKNKIEIQYSFYVEKWEKSGYKPHKLKMTPDRRSKLAIRLKDPEYDLDKIIDMAHKSNDFIQKYITFDWITENDKNWRKVIEGNYLEKGQIKKAENEIKTNGLPSADELIRGGRA